MLNTLLEVFMDETRVHSIGFEDRDNTHKLTLPSKLLLPRTFEHNLIPSMDVSYSPYVSCGVHNSLWEELTHETT